MGVAGGSFIANMERKSVDIVVSGCRYGRLSAYAVIARVNGWSMFEKVITVNASLSQLVLAGLVYAIRSIPKGDNVNTINIYIPVSRKSIMREPFVNLLERIRTDKNVKLFPRSARTIESSRLCIERLRCLSEITGNLLLNIGGTGEQKKLRA